MSAEDAFLEDMAQIAEFIQLYHSEQIDELIAGDYDEPTLDISLRKLSHYAPDLYSDLVNEPDNRIPWFQEAVRNFEELCENVHHQTSGYQVKPIPHPIPPLAFIGYAIARKSASLCLLSREFLVFLNAL